MLRGTSVVAAAIVAAVVHLVYAVPAEAVTADNFDTVPNGTYGAAARPEPLSNGWYAIEDGVVVGTPKETSTGPKPTAPHSVRLTYFTGSGTPQSPRVAHPGTIVKIVPTHPGQACDLAVLLGQGGLGEATVGTYYARLQVEAFAQASDGIEPFSTNNPKIFSLDYSAAGKFPNPRDIFWERLTFLNIKPAADFTALRIGSTTNTWIDDIEFTCR